MRYPKIFLALLSTVYTIAGVKCSRVRIFRGTLRLHVVGVEAAMSDCRPVYGSLQE